jgi:Repeat of unknown function (DUF5907)
MSTPASSTPAANTVVKSLGTGKIDPAWLDAVGTVTSVAVASTDLSVSGSPITTLGIITLNVNNDAITNAKLANVATATFKGRVTAGTGDPEDMTVAQAKTLLNLTGTNSGDQTITLTGDVTGSGTGSFAATIANDAVTYAKLQNVGANEVLGRAANSSGDVSGVVIGASQLMGRGATGDLAAITLGTNLSMSGTTLNATGGGGGTISGTITDESAGTVFRLAYSNGTDTIQGAATLIYDPTYNMSLEVAGANEENGGLWVRNTSASNDGASSLILYNATGFNYGAVRYYNSTATSAVFGLTADSTFFAGIGNAGGTTAGMSVRGSLLTLGTQNIPRLSLLADGGVQWTGITTASFPAVSTADNCVLAYDKTLQKLRISENAGAFVDVVGGGSGTVTSVAVSSTDLSVSGSPITTSGTITLNVANDAITNAKLANVATQTFKGRTTGGAGDPEDLTVAQAKTLLNLTGTNSGDVTLSAIGSTPNANGATLTGQALNLEPASASFGGIITTGTQTIAGDKTLNGGFLQNYTSTAAGGEIAHTVLNTVTATLSANQSNSALATLSTLQPAGATALPSYFVGVGGEIQIPAAANNNLANSLIYAGKFIVNYDTSATSGNMASYVVALESELILKSSNASGTVTYPNVYNLYVANEPFTQTGGGNMSISEYRGIYVEALSLGARVSVTNQWNMYIEDTAGGSYFGSPVLVVGAHTPVAGGLAHQGSGGIRTRQAATQDSVAIAGRAGGTSSFNNVITTSTLTASRTFTLPDANLTIVGGGTVTLAGGATSLSGSNTGDQTITLTGDVTGSGTGSFAATIANDAVTYAKIQNVGANEVLGRAASSSGDVSGVAIAASQLMGRGSTGDLAAITLGTNLSMSGTTLNASGGGSGVTTMAAIGSSPNANGATISGVNLNLEPASASFGGVVTTGTQTIAGAKTLSGITSLTSGTASTNTTTGSLVVTGGAGISGAVNVGGAILSETSVTAKPSGTAGIALNPNAATGNFTLSIVPANLTAGRTATIPDATGTVLYRDSSVAATRILYGVDANTAGAESTFTYDSANNRVALNGDLTLTEISAPSDPSAGDGRLYAFDRADRTEPTFLASGQPAYDLQAGLMSRRIMYILPASGTTIENIGMPDTNVGTVSTANPATTNARTWARRFALISAAGAGSSAETRSTAGNCYRGNAAGVGGFTYFSRFSTSTAVTDQRLLVGLLAATGATANVNPSTLTDCVFVGYDTGDANLQIMHNDSAGTCTKVDLGANFPSLTTTTAYTVMFHCVPNGSTIGYRVVNLGTGNIASGTLSTNLPTSTSFLSNHLWINNGTTASAAEIESSIVYIEVPM